jgi:Fic family protein
MLYYDNLRRVSMNNDMTQWLKFFLTGVRDTSESSIQTFKRIISLREDSEKSIMQLGKKVPMARSFLEYLYSHPKIDAQSVSEELNVNISTALRLIDDFVKLNILVEVTGYKRNRIFSFESYMDIFR